MNKASRQAHEAVEVRQPGASSRSGRAGSSAPSAQGHSQQQQQQQPDHFVEQSNAGADAGRKASSQNAGQSVAGKASPAIADGHRAPSSNAKQQTTGRAVHTEASSGTARPGHAGDHQAATSSSRQRQLGSKKRDKAVISWTQHVVTTQPGRARPVFTIVTRTAAMEDDSDSSEASDEVSEEAAEAVSGAAAAAQGSAAEVSKKQAGEEASLDTESGAEGAETMAAKGVGTANKGQQQIARLTTSNTALLAELVDLQVSLSCGCKSPMPLRQG